MKTKNHLHTKGDYSINSWKLGNERTNSFKFTKEKYLTHLNKGLHIQNVIIIIIENKKTKAIDHTCSSM
jgi:hypothetical protein